MQTQPRVPQEIVLHDLVDAVTSTRTDRSRVEFHLGRAQTAMNALPLFPVARATKAEWVKEVRDLIRALEGCQAPIFLALKKDLTMLALRLEH